MRISTIKGDPGYTKNLRNVFVSLDGDMVRSCITADSKLGMVVRSKRDERNDLVIKDGEVVIETVYGVVNIITPLFWQP